MANIDYKALSELLFPDVTRTPEDLEIQFPLRNLPEGAAVTRFAPSPTGFIHFGNLFAVITAERLLTRVEAYSTSELRIPTQSVRCRER